MKQTIIETPDGYKVDVVEKVDNVLIRFLKEEEKYVPKDGDVVYDQSCNERCNNISIYKTQRGGYVRLFVESKNLYFEDDSTYENIRPATPEEQKKLFDALAKAGKMWNAENKKILDTPKLLVPDNIHIFQAKDDNTRPLFIGFNESKQVLGYNKKRGCWIVLPCYPFKFERVQCELVEVKREELKDGDLCFRTDKLNPNLFRSEITNYAIIDGECDVWIDKTPTKGPLSWGYWYKLKPING